MADVYLSAINDAVVKILTPVSNNLGVHTDPRGSNAHVTFFIKPDKVREAKDALDRAGIVVETNKNTEFISARLNDFGCSSARCEQIVADRDLNIDHYPEIHVYSHISEDDPVVSVLQANGHIEIPIKTIDGKILVAAKTIAGKRAIYALTIQEEVRRDANPN